MSKLYDESWTTKDEIKALDFMASSKKRGKGEPTIVERFNRVKAWIDTAEERIWPEHVSVVMCKRHARNLLTQIK